MPRVFSEYNTSQATIEILGAKQPDRDYKQVRDYFLKLAEKMPEANYASKPSPDVRTCAQQVAHDADDQYNLCAPAKGETKKAAYKAVEDSLSHITKLSW